MIVVQVGQRWTFSGGEEQIVISIDDSWPPDPDTPRMATLMRYDERSIMTLAADGTPMRPHRWALAGGGER